MYPVVSDNEQVSAYQGAQYCLSMYKAVPTNVHSRAYQCTQRQLLSVLATRCQCLTGLATRGSVTRVDVDGLAEALDKARDIGIAQHALGDATALLERVSRALQVPLCCCPCTCLVPCPPTSILLSSHLRSAALQFPSVLCHMSIHTVSRDDPYCAT